MKSQFPKAAIVLFLVNPFMLLSCNKDASDNTPKDPVPISLTASQVSVVKAGNAFALDFFRKSVEATPETKNIIVSPLSISTALSMTMNGAAGETSKAMQSALRISGMTTEEINKAYKDLTAALLSVDRKVLISIANSVWIEKYFAVKKPFTDALTNYYNAESESFSVSDPAAPDAINNWIEKKTNGLIKEMVGAFDPTTVMLLINTIYFKGQWKQQFDKEKTVAQSFYKYGGTAAQVPMMKQTSNYRVFRGDNFTMAEFPYGQGNFVMDVFLPDEREGLGLLLPRITESNIATWLGSMADREISLSFPKFKFGYKNELNKILTDMGMGIAFTGDADFSNISDQNLLISSVLHQAFIETNEEGTEAAAATVVIIKVTSVLPGPMELQLDHPFIYMIRETTTNSILFMGRVSDPLAE